MSGTRVFIAIAAAFVLALGYVVWRPFDGVPNGVQAVDSHIAGFEEVGADAGRGNLIALQPWMVPGDYSNVETLFAKLDGYFAQAKAKGWLNQKSIVVLPEYIGSWLAAADERAGVYREAGIRPAMTMMALAHPAAFLRRYLSAPAVADKAKWALFTLKSENMARDYQSVFGKLAKKYGVTIVAGSIVLPEPRLIDGRLEVKPGGTLYNVSALFTPDGGIAAPLIIKAYPIDEEKTFTVAGKPNDIPVFATPAGRLAVLICADSWYQPPYRRIAQLHAELLAIPSYSSEDDSWAQRWTGYNGAPTPADVDRSDIGKISEGGAWLKYSMGGKAAAANINAGVNVFLRGRLWDMGADGTTIYFQSGKIARVPDRHGAVLTNEWL